ncbi:protein required for cytochrome oxidase assembly [Vibrio sp. B1REV9]|uniref:COX15/CtaA family protein n=1 Tax=Vibrio sp. B1REV9 TaxID=2751179 RepID=UPI001AFB2DE9|nr:COX15/CtaA family protein [Vibrio sp. B1REV9]CAE6929790.1 protein required for cytochrome oxidase assembly [Vibrio sp. B1REV9]
MSLTRLVQFSLCLTLVVIMLGAYTRLADAGLGCPDWPGCYGQLLVPQTEAEISKANTLFPERAVEQDKAWLEMIHRYFAGSLGIVILIMAISATKSERVDATIPILLCLLVIGQAALGMWTVTLKLMPVIVMLHLLGGFTLLVLQAVFYCQLKSQNSLYFSPSTKSVRLFSLITFCVVLAQVLLGGWTSSNYAALMCTALPICEGDWTSYLSWKAAFSFWQSGFDNYEFGVLDYPARMTIHVTHRIGAIITACVVLIYSVLLLKQDSHHSQRLGVWIGLALVCQILLGVSNVVFQLPIYVAVAHNLGAAVMLSLICVSQFYLWQGKPRWRHQAKGVRYE